jgi:predicted ABC-type ATPase
MPKTIYVVGGTNGVGKSTIREELLGSSIPYINADFIAKELKVQHASLMLAELARQYGSEQMKKYIAAEESFAFENNLHEAKTYEWLKEMQSIGYRIELYYIGVNNLQITTKRIQERVKRGEHYVPPDEVFARYENGLKLLRHYFSVPDKLLIIDNTDLAIVCLQADKGDIKYQVDDPFEWIGNFLASLETKTSISARSLSSIEEVRKLYESKRSNKEIDENP